MSTHNISINSNPSLKNSGGSESLASSESFDETEELQSEETATDFITLTTTSSSKGGGGIQNSNSAATPPLLTSSSTGVIQLKMMQAFRSNSTGSGNGNSGSKRTSRLPSLHRSCDSSEDSSCSGM